LGLISYGIYLWQMTVIDQLKKWNFSAHSVINPQVWWTAGTFVLTVLIAATSYYLLERRALTLKNVFGRRATLRGGAGRAGPGRRNGPLRRPRPTQRGA
jgi:peptidoglycan/LPS O-acetylase OafA/YrhL